MFAATWKQAVFFVLFFMLFFASFLLASAQEKTPPAREPLDKLFQDVELPRGDPIPDFVAPPWVPPSTDRSKLNKRGTDFGPAMSFTVQLSKNRYVRRGLTVRLPRDQAILYDLDTLAVAATWQGGFLDISKTHLEDSKGSLAGRPGGEPIFWLDEDIFGWADASSHFHDNRKVRHVPPPKQHIDYRGHFLHGYRTILSYGVLDRDVLEMPGVAEDGPAGSISRTFHVGAGERTVRLAIVQKKEKNANFTHRGKRLTPQNRATATRDTILLKEADGLVRAAALVNPPANCRWQVEDDILYLELPASRTSTNFAVLTWSGSPAVVSKLEKWLSKRTFVADLRNYVRGGPGRWQTPLTTAGKLGDSTRAYTVDTLTLPDSNPWKSWIRPAAIDFFSDGRLAMSSMNGDVWLCSGIDRDLKQLRWQRFATGLYEPLGLRIVDDKLYVLGRDRITRLHDFNADGEADYYQSFFAGGTVSPSYHAFAFDLQTDSQGNFYFVKSGRKAEDAPDQNALLKVSADGERWEVVATGFRHPNGLGVGPHDEIVIGDNQGEFVPSSKLSLVSRGKYYGYGKLDPEYARPLLWLPMSQDNSSGGQVWAPHKWGPLSGKLLHTSYGTCKLFYVLPQFVAGQTLQATAIPLDELHFLSGIMRGRIDPVDGQLYLSGLNGWGSKAKQDGCLHRVRYTGRPAYLVDNVTLAPEGLRLHFTCPLDRTAAANPKNYQLEQWNYIYSQRYGSPEMSVEHPQQKGHDPLTVSKITLEEDGRSVLLHLPKLRPVDQLHITLTVRAGDGHAVHADLFSTIHRVPTDAPASASNRQPK